MATKITYETKQSKAKRVSDSYKSKLETLSKAETAALLQSLIERLEVLENA